MNTCYVYILCSRRDRHITIRATPDLRHAIRYMRRRIARQLGRRKVYQKVVLIESFAGLTAAVARQKELESMTPARLRHLINRRNPTWKSLSISGYLNRKARLTG